jgi:hypothetical protein
VGEFGSTVKKIADKALAIAVLERNISSLKPSHMHLSIHDKMLTKLVVKSNVYSIDWRVVILDRPPIEYTTPSHFFTPHCLHHHHPLDPQISSVESIPVHPLQRTDGQSLEGFRGLLVPHRKQR